MKIEITLNHETTTENGQIIQPATYTAEYNAARGVIFDSKEIEKYNALRLNEKLINRAIINAEENNLDNGNGEFKGNTCSIKLF